MTKQQLKRLLDVGNEHVPASRHAGIPAKPASNGIRAKSDISLGTLLRPTTTYRPTG